MGLLRWAVCLVCTWHLLTIGSASGAHVVLPTGLAPGSQYQLVFVSVWPTTAYSANVEDYDAFINSQIYVGIDSGLPAGLTWHAVVSTPTVNARDHAPSTVPVYNTQGQLLSSTGLYAGSLLTPIRFNQAGNPYSLETSSVWTGSDQFGVGIPGHTLGDPSLFSMVGGPLGTDGSWSVLFPVPQANTWAIYALSDPITVPVPEPGTLALLGSAIVALAGVSLTRRGARTNQSQAG